MSRIRLQRYEFSKDRRIILLNPNHAHVSVHEKCYIWTNVEKQFRSSHFIIYRIDVEEGIVSVLQVYVMINGNRVLLTL